MRKTDQSDVLNFKELKACFFFHPEAHVKKSENGWIVTTGSKTVCSDRHDKIRVWKNLGVCIKTLESLGCKQIVVKMEDATA